ncbi:hypothetical protein KR054_009687 [Drosophila jambulina]|nr:hypothetical protein KR054_009687 [Drosophila jambulina]
MDLSEFPDIDIDRLLDSTTTLEDGLLAPYKQISLPKVNARAREKRSRLAERIAQGDELVRKVRELQAQNKQLADLQRTAQEVTDLYQKEKQQRLELQKQSQQLGERCAKLEKELDVQVINCEKLQEELETRALPVDAKEVLGVLLQLEQRLGDEAGLARRDQNTLKKLKDYCRTANISLPAPKSPVSQRNKRRSQATQTDTEPVPEKPTLCSVAVQVENLIQTRDQGTQHKNTTTTRGTTTASFIRKHDVGTSFPEPKPLPNVRQILDEMLSWRDAPLRPLSPLCDLLPELESIPATVSVATCTTLCNVHREIDFMPELPSQIKVSASRPPSRAMLDSVKEEARSSRELARELLNFLPHNQSCLANLPPQAFEELWQVFGQMVLGLLQRRSSPPTVSQADFTSWLYELYEGAQQAQPEEAVASQKGNNKTTNKKKSVSGLIQTAFLLDFCGSTERMDVGTDPIIASPNISHGGDVTPIRLPPKPRERRHKKRKAAAACLIKPVAKRTCGETEPPKNHADGAQESAKEPETAIQFLSNLNTFNMANCDNLDMELDEEEMYLLQLTSNSGGMQEEKEQAEKDECVSLILPLPKVQEETESSLKDDKELKHSVNTENLENSDGINYLSTVKLLGELPASSPKTPQEAEEYLYSNDSDSEDNTIQSVKGTTLNSNPHKSNKSKGSDISYLFGSDSDMESEASEEDTDLDSKVSKEAVSESESESCKQKLLKKETKWSPIASENEEEISGDESDSSEQQLSKEDTELETKETEENFSESQSESSKQKNTADQADLVSSLPFGESISDLEKNEKLLRTQLWSPASDDSEDENKLILDVEMSPRKASEDSPPPVATPKRRRTQSELKSPPTPCEGRLTRQRAKQLLLEQNSSTESRISLVEQLRNQLKEATNKSEPLKGICSPIPKCVPFPVPAKCVEQKKPIPEDLKLDQSYSYNEDSPASPCSEPTDELVDSITEIPLEQQYSLEINGQPKSIIQHVIDQNNSDAKRRKTLGKSQPKLCAAIGQYLQESLELDDLSLEVYKLTKDEAVIVNAMVVVVTKIGIEETPLERLLSALENFNFTQRFLAELEERLFRNTKERPPTELAMNYVKLYLAAVSSQASVTQEYTNPARLLLAKLLYHYELDMPVTVLEVLRHFPTVLPHREERQYDHSDPLITVMKHLLMSRTYDMQDPDGAERLLLSKLRFEYHYQPYEPSKQQVLENLVEKLKAGRSLEQLGYAIALFCRRSPHIKDVDLLVTEHLMPLATSYCDLAAGQDEAYDDRLAAVLQCISMALKPLPVDTDISAFAGLVKRLIVAVPRPRVQQAAVQACLRLQRFGFQTIRDTLQNYRPDYPLDPLTRAMLRCFAQRRKHYHILAARK